MLGSFLDFLLLTLSSPNIPPRMASSIQQPQLLPLDMPRNLSPRQDGAKWAASTKTRKNYIKTGSHRN